MLTLEKIQSNKQMFCYYLNNFVKRENSKIKELLEVLETYGFFSSPASIDSTYNYEGGLCELCLNTYKRFSTMCHNENSNIPEDTICILGLLLNIGRLDMFEKYSRNVKVYTEDGNKYDENGKFKWTVKYEFAFKKNEDKMFAVSGEQLTLLLLQNNIQLTEPEIIAILNSDCGTNKGYVDRNLMNTLVSVPITVVLHSALLLATYLDGHHE